MTQRDELECRLHRFRADVVFRTGACARLIDRLAGQHAERDRDRQRRRELGERSRDRVGEDVEVRRLTSDQAAERHDGIKASGSREGRHGRGQLERARDLKLLDLRAFRQGGLNGRLGEGTGDLVVPAGSDDRDVRAGAGILLPRRSLPRSRHLPQSSPRMRYCPVSR